MSDAPSAAEGLMSDRKRLKRDAIKVLVTAAQDQGDGKKSKSARTLIKGGWVTQAELETLTSEEIMHRVDELIPN